MVRVVSWVRSTPELRCREPETVLLVCAIVGRMAIATETCQIRQTSLGDI